MSKVRKKKKYVFFLKKKPFIDWMTIYSIKIKSSKKSDIFKSNVRCVLTSISPPNEEEITVGFFIDPPNPRCNSP